MAPVLTVGGWCLIDTVKLKYVIKNFKICEHNGGLTVIRLQAMGVIRPDGFNRYPVDVSFFLSSETSDIMLSSHDSADSSTGFCPRILPA